MSDVRATPDSRACTYLDLYSPSDSSRSQQLLEAKGVSDAKPAPVLAPAHIEGKAASDALIKVRTDGNDSWCGARGGVFYRAMRGVTAFH